MEERSGYRNGRLIYPISVTDHTQSESGQGGGGDASHPLPNSVNSETIQDGSIKLEDLNEEVLNRMTEVYDPTTGTLYANGSRP